MKKNKPFLIILCLLQLGAVWQTQALNKPVLLAPGNGSTGYVRNPGFSWSTVTGAYSYDIEVATDTGFTQMLTSRQNLYITRFVPVNALPAGKVYWRVRARDTTATDSSAWSSRFTYIVAAPARVYTIPAGASLKAFKDTLRKAISNTPAVLKLASATYTFDAGITGLFAIDTANVNDLIIEGNNANIIIRNHPQTGFMKLRNSNRVAIRQLTVDWDPLPHALLDVIDVNKTNPNTLDVRVRLRQVAGQSDAYYPAIFNNPSFTNHWSWAFLLDPANRGSLKKVPRNVFGLSADDVTPLFDIDPYQYHIVHPGSSSGQYFSKGDILAIVARDNVGSFISTYNCVDITCDSIINYASPIGCYYSYEGSEMKVLNCHAALKDTTRYVSANADGVHCRANLVGPWIENCSFVGNADDGVALYNKGMFVMAKNSTTSVTVKPDFMNLAKGHTFKLYIPKTGFVAEPAFVVDTVIVSGGNYRINFSPAIPADDYAAMTDLGLADLQQNVQLFNVSLRNEKFMIHNNLFTIRGRGSIIRSAKGMVSNNRYYRCSSPAVAFYNEAASWTNGLYSRDAWIQNNDIQNCGFDNLGMKAGSIQVVFHKIVKLGSSYQDSIALNRQHANLFITGNTIRNLSQHGITLFNASSSKVLNNNFVSDITTFPLTGAHYGIYLDRTNACTILNNQFSGEIRPLTSNIHVTNSTNVVSQ
ncbi:right-handed parallel beta-helix repeat-containing protein [Longitalea arenae]|uniref:right-handed parallel beta-helix repeat-containing protein n=1 Tax=Longitalea arenae TaxID=2812558 RepID=UPI0019688F73|nr:right-handed parallel beta-helix repeat-containing protein [Longitalea arenae]